MTGLLGRYMRDFGLKSDMFDAFAIHLSQSIIPFMSTMVDVYNKNHICSSITE